jgi:N-methylhydantoinase A
MPNKKMNLQNDARHFSIGVDIGGTCTDVAMFDPATNTHSFFKTETTPTEVALGVVNGVKGVLDQQGRLASDCVTFIHGTTLALNAVLTREGARVGLLVTRGFGDLLEIGRLQMPDPFNFYTQKAVPLIRRNFVREVDERILASGAVHIPLDVVSVERAAAELVERGAEILTVCLVNAFKNPDHERQIGAIVRSRYPAIRVSLSSDVWPEIREYERSLVTVINAFVTPKVSTYLDRLQDALARIDLGGSVNITTSNGGMLPVRLAKVWPAATLMSGPASGVIASARLAEDCGLGNVIAFDMGGTSSDFAVLVDHRIPYSSETRISGLPVVIPSVDVVSVGAGGGSIARLDNLGVLKVGPESAGADPGPGCFGRGGLAPAVTDAYLVSGVLNPEGFLGGKVRLDVTRAHKAIENLAAGTRFSTDEIAEGILRVATSNMIPGIAAIEGRIGFDIRDFSLLAYGGAGPTHACMLAEELGIRSIVIPPSPGTFCALGSLSADFRLDYVQTLKTPIDAPDWDSIVGWYAEKQAQARAELTGEPSIESLMILPTFDTRFEGQGFNTEVPVSIEIVNAQDSEAVRAGFFARYEQLYGVSQPSVPGEIVNLRLTVVGQRRRYRSRRTPGVIASPSTSSQARRSVYFDGVRREIPVFQRSDLGVDARVSGPCIIDQIDTTIFVRPLWHGTNDDLGNLHLQQGSNK